MEQLLHDSCDEIINLIKSDIIPKAGEAEAKAFFLKMIGDYCRYIAESAKGDKLEECKKQALTSYDEAQTISVKDLGACHSIRLGLALNFSVFHYEVMGNVGQACELGNKALSDALDQLDSCDEETFRDAQSIIELLRENLSLWKEEAEEGGGAKIDDL